MKGLVQPTSGVRAIARERHRQIEQEGWSAEHDDTHTDDNLAIAAACYALPVRARFLLTNWWPWNSFWWKPTPDNRIRELEKAGALIAAEIERLERKG